MGGSGLLVLVLSLLSSLACARTIADIHVPESITQKGQDRELLLNGAGIRKKFLFDIYLAALYLPERTQDATAVETMPGANRLVMWFLYPEVNRKKMDRAWRDGFSANNPAATVAALTDHLEAFKALFGDLHEGDEVWIDYLPGSGTSVSINGELRGVVPGRDFNRALLRVWLGPEPVTDDLKQGLLGLD